MAVSMRFPPLRLGQAPCYQLWLCVACNTMKTPSNEKHETPGSFRAVNHPTPDELARMTLNSSARHIVAVGGSTETQACCVHSPVVDGGRSDHRELYGGRFARAPDSRWLLPFWSHVWENGGTHDYSLQTCHLTMWLHVGRDKGYWASDLLSRSYHAVISSRSWLRECIPGPPRAAGLG